MAEEKRVIRFGLLGCSDIAPTALLKPAAKLDHVKVIACAARDPARAMKFAKKHDIPKAHPTYEDLIRDPDIDAVYVSLPNSLHCKWAIDAMNAGKHVLCEKPMANNADEVQLMAAAAQKNNVLLMEAYHNLYHPMVQRIKELCKKEMDQIKHIETIITFPIFSGSDIRYNYALGGGATMDAGCYAVSLMRFLTEEEPEVDAAVAKLAYPNVDKTMSAQFKFPSGITASMKASIFSIPDISLRIEGHNGTVISATNWLAPHMLYNLVKVQDALGTWREEKFSRSVSTYTYQLSAFAEAIASGNYNVLTDSKFGLANQQVIDTIYVKAGLPIRGSDVASSDDPQAGAGAGQAPAEPTLDLDDD